MEFTLLHDRGLTEEVVFMKWCPLMDLLAVCFNNNRIVIHRLLSWQSLLELTIENDDETPGFISSVAWRPDGKVLAVGCRDGRIELYNIETKELLQTNHKHSTAITVLEWFQHEGTESTKTSETTADISNLSLIHTDRTHRFFDKLPAFPAVDNGPQPGHFQHRAAASHQSTPIPAKSFENRLGGLELDVLVSGDEQGGLRLWAYGIYIYIYHHLSLSLCVCVCVCMCPETSC